MTITITKLRLGAAVLALAMLVPATAWATHVFVDVDDASPFAADIEWASTNSIAFGRDATHFDPGAGVTRQESVAFLHRYDTNIVQPVVAGLPTILTAEIDETGAVTGGTAGVTTSGGGDGSMDVNFPSAVSGCHWQATIAEKGTLFTFAGNNGEVSLQTDLDGIFPASFADPNGIFVETRDSSGTVATMPVFLLVICT